MTRSPGPPDQQGGETAAPRPQTLERPPGDRYRDAGPPHEGPGVLAWQRWGPVVGVVLGGAVLLGALGFLDLSVGLIAVSAIIGWLAGETVTTWVARLSAARRVGVAAVAAAASVILGLGLVWVVSRMEGGTLGPVEYVAERYGLLAVVLVLVAGGAAAFRARQAR